MQITITKAHNDLHLPVKEFVVQRGVMNWNVAIGCVDAFTQRAVSFYGGVIKICDYYSIWCCLLVTWCICAEVVVGCRDFCALMNILAILCPTFERLHRIYYPIICIQALYRLQPFLQVPWCSFCMLELPLSRSHCPTRVAKGNNTLARGRAMRPSCSRTRMSMCIARCVHV